MGSTIVITISLRLNILFKTQWFDSNWMEENNKEKSEKDLKHMNITEEIPWKDYEEMLKLEVYIEDYEEEEEEEDL